MTTKNKTSVALFCFLFAAFAVSHAKESTDPTVSAASSPYPVMDSGVWADWQFNSEISWIDNDRIIFKNSETKDKTKHYSSRFNLAIWDITTNKVTPYTDYYQSVTACIQDGMIHRTQKDARGNVQRFYGRFGEEKLFEFPKTKGAFFDDMNCRPNDNPEILAKRQAGRAIKPLLDRYGYLDVGPIREKPGIKESAVFYPSGRSKGIELPILGRDASIVSYYPFKGAYLIHGLNYGGGVKSKKFWWLYPDGKVEEHSIPVETNPYPTRKGIVTTRGAPKLNRHSSLAGLYLWGGKEPVELLAGYTEGVRVSPDGCKLAFVHYLYADATLIKDPGRITLKIIDLCMEEKTHGK